MRRHAVCAVLVLGLALVSATGLLAEDQQVVVSGEVLDPVGRQPLPGAVVAIGPLAGQETSSVVTDSDGRFSFPDLPSGAYRVRFSLPGFHTVVRFVLAAPGARRDLTVVLAMNPEALVITRETQVLVDPASPVAPSTITGTVTAPNGSVWPGLTVRVYGLGGGGVAEVTTDARGRYSLPRVPGVYRIVLGAQPGFAPVARDEVEVGPGTVVHVDGVVRAAEPNEFGGGTPRRPGEGDLNIRVVDARGLPMPAAEISIPEVPGFGTRRTDETGQLWVVLPAGRYSVRAVVPGFEETTASPVVVRDGLVTTAGLRMPWSSKYGGL